MGLYLCFAWGCVIPVSPCTLVKVGDLLNKTQFFASLSPVSSISTGTLHAMVMHTFMRCRQKRIDTAASGVARRLLKKVWSLDTLPSEYRSNAYLNHYQDLLLTRDLIDGRVLTLKHSQDVIQLIELVKRSKLMSLQQIQNVIQASAPPWLSDKTNIEATQRALEFATRLWLFAKPTFKDLDVKLEDAVKDRFLVPRASIITSRTLSPDFCAKSLTRKGGIVLVWTSVLSDHLKFASKSQLLVFRHTCILRHYRTGWER